MQSEVDDASHKDKNNLLTNTKGELRPHIKMVPESFTSSDTEEDAKQEATLVESDQTELRAWFQRITQMQNEIQKKLCQSDALTASSSASSMPSRIPPPHQITSQPTPAPSPISATRVVKYQDLPYMGEMTLNNSKPRRGRKPKKADICHLIYKNYGTIFPGTPNPRSIVDRGSEKNSVANRSNPHIVANHVEALNRSDVQNRIISSLLEKRLTQESKRHQQQQHQQQQQHHKNSVSSASDISKSKKAKVGLGQISEPLNLCIRDLDHLKIRLSSIQKHNLNNNNNNVSKISDNLEKPLIAEVKEEPREESEDEIEFVHETPSLSLASSNFDFKFPEVSTGTGTILNSQDIIKTSENGVPPGGYVYWPHAGVFIHPLALQQQLLYYQKLTGFKAPLEIDENTTTISPLITIDHPEVITKKPRTLKPQLSETSEDEGSIKDGKRRAGTPSLPAKRKRSAIFIPPIPSENQNNPATEVSICKFKFTGGAKPSLQEKKMLSVDSGGNFRYYSGTGDKSMRGYEFFPRETLQQQIHNSQGSSTGAFLQASGERIYPSSPVDKVNEFMLTPELKAGHNQSLEISTAPASPNDQNDGLARCKKRKSRKSLQREKLEQTFKEKGFLIQTQQLESAEGATYCKFRQLRKFTRYLFRSWKDYLPGNVAEGQAQEGQALMVKERPDEKVSVEEAVGGEQDSVSNLSSPRMNEPSPSPL